MRHSVPDGGKAPLALWKLAAASLLVGAFASATAQEPARAPDADSAAANFMVPQGIIPGGFSAPTAPVPGRAATGPFIKLLYPSAIAANGPDLYVADNGQGVLLRIDTMTRAATRLRQLPPSSGTRLKTGPDGSVFVVSPGRRDVERLARDGRRIAVFSAKFELLQPADIIVEPNLNRVWISDAAGGVFAFHPSGRLSEPLAGRGDGFPDENSGATYLGAGRHRVAGIDPRCRCVVEFNPNGIVIGRFGEGQLIYPTELAIDTRDRTWVLDRGDHRLKIFANGGLLASITPAQLGLIDITGIALDTHLAYIADGPGGRIGTFAILQSTR